MSTYTLVSDMKPSGDQPEAIRQLTEGVLRGDKFQTLLGVTGSGKTFTVSNVIAGLDKPVLVMSHNKTLAAQLYAEFKRFFPKDRVEFFISYYDYYQPEAYVPQTDTYIEKDSSVNDEIERLRHSATAALLTRRDVLIVASVSAIYGLGDPEAYRRLLLTVETGVPRDAMIPILDYAGLPLTALRVVTAVTARWSSVRRSSRNHTSNGPVVSCVMARAPHAL